MKEEAVKKAIEDITYESRKFPKEAFRVISENKELALPYLTAALKKAVEEKDELEEGYQLHFYALFFMGQFQERNCFPEIMKLAMLPSETLDYLIGDAITGGLPDALYNTYNGEAALLKEAVKNPEVDDFVRSGMLGVMGQLCLDGKMGKEEVQAFIREIVLDEEDIGDYIYSGITTTLCGCHWVDMLPEIRKMYEDGRIDEYVLGSYSDCVDMMFDYRYNTKLCKTPMDAAEILQGGAMFQDASEKGFSKKDIDKLVDDVEAEYARETVKIKVGRNDLCPCGSGKKYKKCCLNRPASPLDVAESGKERERWLRDYPASAAVREEGKIYLEDFFDAESIEIDKLVYLALHHRAIPLWRNEQESVVENRKKVYLTEAFLKFEEKAEKENVKTCREYDEKYAIHYSCGEWLEALLRLLKNGKDRDLYGRVKKCFEGMNG